MGQPDMPGDEHIGRVEVDVVPNAKDFGRRVRRDIDAEADKAGRDLGRSIAKPVGDEVASSVLAGMKQGGKDAGKAGRPAGRDYGDAFAQELQAGIRKALRSMPAVDLNADSSSIDRAAEHIRKELAGLTGKRIGLDITDEQAITRLQALRNELSALARDVEKLRARRVEIRIDLDAVQAMADLTALKTSLSELRDVTINVDVDTGQATAQLDAVAVAAAAITGNATINVDVDTMTALAEIAAMDDLLTLLGRNRTISIDVDTAPAAASLAVLEGVLDRATRDRTISIDVDTAAATTQLATFSTSSTLTTTNPTINVDVDMMAAIAQLARLEQIVNLVTRDRTINIDVDALAASGKLAGLDFAAAFATRDRTINIDVDTGAALAKIAALIGVIQSANVSLGSLGGSAGGAAGMMGLLTFAVIALIAALVPLAAAATVVAGAIGVGFAVAIAGAATLLLGLVPIVGAFKALTKAEDDQAKSAAQAASRADAVADATRNLGRTQEQVARQIVAADQRVTEANKAVAAATKDVAKAELAVSEARRQAQRDIEDLASALEHNAQDQRQNALDLAAAQQELDLVLWNPASTATQIEAAQLAFDKLTTQNRDLKRQSERLTEQQQKQDVVGVEGSDRVVAAKEALTRAEEALESRRVAYAQAQTARQQAEVDGAQRIADAERALSRAREQQAAQLAGVGTAAGDAREKMAALTDEARSLVQYLHGIDFKPLQRAAMGFAEPLEKGLRAFLPTMLPVITEFVKNVSAGIGESFQTLLKAFSSPFWQDFFKFLGETAKTALPLFAQGFEDIVRGVAGLIRAFAPVAKVIGGGFLKMLDAFADWSEGLAENKGFQEFVDYAMSQMPRLGEFFASFFDALGNLLIALAPIGEVVIDAMTAIFEFIAGLDPAVLTGIIVAIMGIAAAFGAMSIIGTIASTIATFISVVGAIAGAVGLAVAPFLAIVAAVVAVGAALVYLFNTNKTFHDFVIAAWEAVRDAVVLTWTDYIKPALVAFWEWIQTRLIPAIVWFWQNVMVPAWAAIRQAVADAWVFLQPIFDQISQTIRENIIPVVLLLWHNVIEPAFAGISAAVDVAWSVIQVIFHYIWMYITEVLAPVFMWLWHNVIEPVWHGIRAAIIIAWGIIGVIFAAIQIFIEGVLAPVFTWLWHEIIEPTWVGIRDTIVDIWENHIRPILEVVGNYIEKHVAPAFRAGVAALSEAWNQLIDFLKIPVDFMVNVVINKGIIAGLRWLAGELGVTDVTIRDIDWPPPGWNATVPTPLGPTFTGHATGGPIRGPGTSTSDSILARLSTGEHVWTASEVSAVGGHKNIMILRRLALTGLLSKLAGFAHGGPADDTVPGFAIGGAVKRGWGVIGDALTWVSKGVEGAADLVSDFTRQALSAIKDPGRVLQDLADKMMALMPGRESLFGRIVTGVPAKAIEFMEQKFEKLRAALAPSGGGGAQPWSGTLSPDPLLKRMQEFALNQRGKTYLWSAVGPNRYDCSGLVGNLWAIATGNPLYRRYMSTADMGAGRHGMVSGPGRFTVYLGPGHTAANIDGLHAEAFGGNGTQLAIGHIGTRLGYYYTRLHLPGLAGGGAINPARMTSDDERLKAFLSAGWPEPPVSFRFDAGGLLYDTRGLPGHVMPVYHGSSKPDAVLTDQQWRDLHSLAVRAAEGQGRTGVHIDNYWEKGSDAHEVARDLDWLSRGLG